jgi:dCMP deaminase
MKNSTDSVTRWDQYLYGFAKHAAIKSKDSTQVGAVLVGPNQEVRLTGFNGPPRGVNDSADRRERPKKYLFAAHAEANLIAFAAREGISTKNCKVYVTHMPCSSCAKTLIQAGIIEVIAGPNQTRMPMQEFDAAAEMFQEAGVRVRMICEAV